MGLFCFNCNLLQEEVEEERMKVFVIANFRTTHMCVCQLRSECLACTFRANCCSARLSRAQIPAFVGSSIRDRSVCVCVCVLDYHYMSAVVFSILVAWLHGLEFRCPSLGRIPMSHCNNKTTLIGSVTYFN